MLFKIGDRVEYVIHMKSYIGKILSIGCSGFCYVIADEKSDWVDVVPFLNVVRLFQTLNQP